MSEDKNLNQSQQNLLDELIKNLAQNPQYLEAMAKTLQNKAAEAEGFAVVDVTEEMEGELADFLKNYEAQLTQAQKPLAA